MHLHIKRCEFPLPRRNLLLLSVKMATPLKIAQYPPREFHIRHKVAAYTYEPSLSRIYPHFALQLMKNSRLPRRRLKIGIRSIIKLRHIFIAAGICEQERLRDHLKQFFALLRVFLPHLLNSPLFS